MSKKFRFGGLTPKPEVVFGNFFVLFCRSLPGVGFGEETKSLSCIVNEKVWRGQKSQNCYFRGLRNQYAPQTWGNVRRPSVRPSDEIWSTKCSLVEVKKVSKNFRFGGLTPKPEVVFAIFFVPFCRSLPDVGYGEETKSLSCIVNEKA